MTEQIVVGQLSKLTTRGGAQMMIKRIVFGQMPKLTGRGWAFVICGALGSLGSSIPVAAQTYISFDGPSGAKETWSFGINDPGQIAGYYLESDGITTHCFIRVNGNSYDFSKNNATFCSSESINNRGEITGAVGNENTPCPNSFPNWYTTLGFFRTSAGTVTQFNASNAVTTQGFSVNTYRLIAGSYLDALCVSHGFLRKKNGRIYQIDAAKGGTGEGQGTFLFSVNDSDVSTGDYVDASGLTHGIEVLQVKGNKHCGKGECKTFDVQGASNNLGVGKSINNSGVITGSYTDINGAYHGFVRAADGTITKYDPAGSGTNPKQGTHPLSINDKGVIAGWFYDMQGNTHGFVRAADGTITQIDYPNSLDTDARSVNVNGDITGEYIDSARVRHGYLRTP